MSFRGTTRLRWKLVNVSRLSTCTIGIATVVLVMGFWNISHDGDGYRLMVKVDNVPCSSYTLSQIRQTRKLTRSVSEGSVKANGVSSKG